MGGNRWEGWLGLRLFGIVFKIVIIGVLYLYFLFFKCLVGGGVFFFKDVEKIVGEICDVFVCVF